jgi:hypothetical protein
VQCVQPLESCAIALLGKPDRFSFRYVPGFGSSRSSHASRRDASFIAMRRPFQKLYSLFVPRNGPASARAVAGQGG